MRNVLQAIVAATSLLFSLWNPTSAIAEEPEQQICAVSTDHFLGTVNAIVDEHGTPAPACSGFDDVTES